MAIFTLYMYSIREVIMYNCHLDTQPGDLGTFKGCYSVTSTEKSFSRAYGKEGIRNRKRNRNRNRNPNPNPSLRNITWRRFCLKSVTNNIVRSRLFIPTLYLFIVIIFFIVAFFVYGVKLFFENFIYA